MLENAQSNRKQVAKIKEQNSSFVSYFLVDAEDVLFQSKM